MLEGALVRDATLLVRLAAKHQWRRIVEELPQ
jgi:hypothetical protein